MSFEITKTADGQRVEITLSIPTAEADAIGLELDSLVERMDTALWALGLLRTGTTHRPDGVARPITAEHLYTVITDLEHRLAPRLQGITAATIREHARLGGSYGELARAMDVPRSTAQRRRDAVTGNPATQWERWARGY